MVIQMLETYLLFDSRADLEVRSKRYFRIHFPAQQDDDMRLKEIDGEAYHQHKPPSNLGRDIMLVLNLFLNENCQLSQSMKG